MYRGEDVLKVRELFAKGLSKSEIARKLGMDRKTVRRLLEEGPTGAASEPRNRSGHQSLIPTKSTFCAVSSRMESPMLKSFSGRFGA
jgi:transposase